MQVKREITGRHVLVGFIAAFSVIIGVNLVLAYQAVKTFPGLEVENSYVASQEFNARKAAQEALGWTVRASHADGVLHLSITDREGNPVEVQTLKAILGRATHVRDDVAPAFQFNGLTYEAPVDLRAGNWNIRMIATAKNGTEFRQRVVLLKQ
jgi:nitrogen fixation protein FixH